MSTYQWLQGTCIKAQAPVGWGGRFFLVGPLPPPSLPFVCWNYPSLLSWGRNAHAPRSNKTFSEWELVLLSLREKCLDWGINHCTRSFFTDPLLAVCVPVHNNSHSPLQASGQLGDVCRSSSPGDSPHHRHEDHDVHWPDECMVWQADHNWSGQHQTLGTAQGVCLCMNSCIYTFLKLMFDVNWEERWIIESWRYIIYIIIIYNNSAFMKINDLL